MTASEPRRFEWRFSLRLIFVLITIVAVWLAVFLANREKTRLTQIQEDLQSISYELVVDDPNQIKSVALPRVADQFQSWEVYIPPGTEHQLRFGAGQMSEAEMPKVLDEIVMSPGRHRVTLHQSDRLETDYRYTVYVDGDEMINRAMGAEWLPDGWQQATGVGLPKQLTTTMNVDPKPAIPFQLASRVYTARVPSPQRQHFNGSTDSMVTKPGFRLWIDVANRKYPPAIEFTRPYSTLDYGLRNGLRIPRAQKNGTLSLTRPGLRARSPELVIKPEFFDSDGNAVVSSSSLSFQLSASPTARRPVKWSHDNSTTRRTAYLVSSIPSSPNSTVSQTSGPVIEVLWDASRVNDIGFRLAQTPANDGIARVRLRISQGEQHLWRPFNDGSDDFDVRDKALPWVPTDGASTTMNLPVDVADSDDASPVRIRWKTDITEPLQFLAKARTGNLAYTGMPLYPGLPVAFAAEIPKSLAPEITLRSTDKLQPKPTALPFPGGRVITAVVLEFDASEKEWVWLTVQPM